MRKRIAIFTILIAMQALVMTTGGIAPIGHCQDLPRCGRGGSIDTDCWNGSQYVDTTCMITRGDPIYCSNAAADYYEACMAEHSCPPNDH